MDTHPLDPVALIAGLFLGLSGLAIFANRQWDDVDVTAFTAAGVMLIGLLLLGLVVVRFVQAGAAPEPVDATIIRDVAEPTEPPDLRNESTNLDS